MIRSTKGYYKLERFIEGLVYYFNFTVNTGKKWVLDSSSSSSAGSSSAVVWNWSDFFDSFYAKPESG